VNVRNIQLSGNLGCYVIPGTIKTVNSRSLYGSHSGPKLASKKFYHSGVYLATIQIRIIHGFCFPV
jgi:hypothetical protein